MYNVTKFTVKNSQNENIEVNLLVENPVKHPQDVYSYPFHEVMQGIKNYQELQNLINSLQARNILIYDKREGNTHLFFNHIVHPEVGLFDTDENKPERVNAQLDRNGNNCTLEQMLFNICQTHNEPIPDLIKPKCAFRTLYERYRHPVTDTDKMYAKIANAALQTAVVAYVANKLMRPN